MKDPNPFLILSYVTLTLLTATEYEPLELQFILPALQLSISALTPELLKAIIGFGVEIFPVYVTLAATIPVEVPEYVIAKSLYNVEDPVEVKVNNTVGSGTTTYTSKSGS